jgi:hypothetical protein
MVRLSEFRLTKKEAQSRLTCSAFIGLRDHVTHGTRPGFNLKFRPSSARGVPGNRQRPNSLLAAAQAATQAGTAISAAGLPP